MLPWLLTPAPGCSITQTFGENPNWYPATNGHAGIDYGGPIGSKIVAAYKGFIQSVLDYGKNGYGLHIIIEHPDKSLTIYAHLSETYVQVKDQVIAGQPIGGMGNSGNSTGPHLHFEYRPGSSNIAVDPMPYLVNQLPNIETLFFAKVLETDLLLRPAPRRDKSYIRVLRQFEILPIYNVTCDGYCQTDDGYFRIGQRREDGQEERWVEFQPVTN